eukprot:TRINITY_DN2170_c0_g1_i1.p1 TRINITY_DN2170_c0_g1~~TRINITY_DN2170_c0_g1_i1.p1  ORF type:complete len:145 (+),score=36.11 TRINITY_DN2170_c0_g1_i1:29-463(+)
MDKVTVRDLTVPKLEEVALAIEKALKQDFKESSASVVVCPDLTQKPFSLTAKGFGGKSCIADVGGVPNMEFKSLNNKFHYDLKEISEKVVNLPNAVIIGAAACKPEVSVSLDNSELIPNTNIGSGTINTKEAYVDKSGECCLVC